VDQFFSVDLMFLRVGFNVIIARLNAS